MGSCDNYRPTEASVAFTECEAVALFDLIHAHFKLGREYVPEVNDAGLRDALAKIGTARNLLQGTETE